MTINKANKNTADLIYLVSKTVIGVKPELSKCDSMDIDGVFNAARAQGLAAMAAFALNQVIKLPPEYAELKHKAVCSASMFNYERDKIFDAFEKNKVFYLPLKGIILKSFYPKSFMREMSDNDIYFDKTKADTVKRIMEELGYTCKYFDKNHHDVYIKDSTYVFEMHRSLFSEYSSEKFCEYYSGLEAGLIKDKDNNYGYHMTNEDFYIYMICHLYKHYSSGGAGIRYLLDIYLYNRKLGDNLDAEYLKTELVSLELYSFEQTAKKLAEKVYSLEELSDSEQEELQYYIESGCYGTSKHAVANAVKSRGEGSKARYVLRRIIPSEKDLKYGYPLVYRHRILYPLLLVYRPVAGVTKHRKRIFREVSSLKNYKKYRTDSKNRE